MTQNEHDKFSELFTNTLVDAHIEYATGAEGEAYVVYNDNGILFSITFLKKHNKYAFGATELFKSQYSKYGLPKEAVPDHKKVYETVAFAYKTKEIGKMAKKDIFFIFKELLIESDIVFQMRGRFETYMVLNSGFESFAIGYDPETNKYGFKRYELVKTLYKACNIPEDKKPDYPSLYKRTKDVYMAQVAVENIRHLYD